MTHIGFTGTRHGMRSAQLQAVRELLRRLVGPVTAHHGDCVGADSQFHDLALEIGARLVGHPPSSSSRRANRTFHETRIPMDHLSRNRVIVRESHIMIAAPWESTPQTRGGTWYTIRCAREIDKPLTIVLPDGTMRS